MKSLAHWVIKTKKTHLRKENSDMFDIARAWKDASYRASLSSEEQAMLPANPAGEVELSDAVLETIYGGHGHEGPENDIHVDTNGVVCLKSVNVNVDAVLANILSNNPETVICY
jgi:mersacidin/lichenicidin family type 2 lantibiotic